MCAAFAIEHASLHHSDGCVRIHAVLSSSRVQQPPVTEEHVQPFVLRPIQFEAGVFLNLYFSLVLVEIVCLMS